ncbi:hypothetical protein [Spirosoma jeollabukense]
MSNTWSAIHWAVHVLRDKRLSTADRQLYQDMVSRNVTGLQSVLPQMRVCLGQIGQQAPSQDLFDSIAGLLDQLHPSGSSLVHLETRIIELKQLLINSLD